MSEIEDVIAGAAGDYYYSALPDATREGLAVFVAEMVKLLNRPGLIMSAREARDACDFDPIYEPSALQVAIRDALIAYITPRTRQRGRTTRRVPSPRRLRLSTMSPMSKRLCGRRPGPRSIRTMRRRGSAKPRSSATGVGRDGRRYIPVDGTMIYRPDQTAARQPEAMQSSPQF